MRNVKSDVEFFIGANDANDAKTLDIDITSKLGTGQLSIEGSSVARKLRDDTNGYYHDNISFSINSQKNTNDKDKKGKRTKDVHGKNKGAKLRHLESGQTTALLNPSTASSNTLHEGPEEENLRQSGD